MFFEKRVISSHLLVTVSTVQLHTTALLQQHCYNSTATTALLQQHCYNSTATTALLQQHCYNSTATTALLQQHCYNSTATTLLLKTFSFVFVLYSVDLHNCLSVTNASLAKDSLLLTSFCVPPCLDNTNLNYLHLS